MIRWKEGAVYEFAVGDGVYALCQMLKSPYLIVFDSFKGKGEWASSDCCKERVLFVKGVTRQFLKQSEFHGVGLSPIKYDKKSLVFYRPGIEPFKMIVPDGGGGNICLFLHGKEGGHLIEKELCGGAGNSKEIKKVRSYIEAEGFESVSLATFPLFNERLYLCWMLGSNVDPEKELSFGIYSSDKFARYVNIMSGGEKNIRGSSELST